MSVYQQDLVLGDGGIEALETALGRTLDEARLILEGRRVPGTKTERAERKGLAAFR